MDDEPQLHGLRTVEAKWKTVLRHCLFKIQAEGAAEDIIADVEAALEDGPS